MSQVYEEGVFFLPSPRLIQAHQQLQRASSSAADWARSGEIRLLPDDVNYHFSRVWAGENMPSKRFSIQIKSPYSGKTAFIKMAAAPANGPQRISKAARAPACLFIIAVAEGAVSLSAN